jgi:hypothetical protein
VCPLYLTSWSGPSATSLIGMLRRPTRRGRGRVCENATDESHTDRVDDEGAHAFQTR